MACDAVAVTRLGDESVLQVHLPKRLLQIPVMVRNDSTTEAAGQEQVVGRQRRCVITVERLLDDHQEAELSGYGVEAQQRPLVYGSIIRGGC